MVKMMAVGDICREYRLAKDKDKQIEIIADQCDVNESEIIKVLVDCGEMEQPAEKPEPKKVSKQSKVVVPEAVAEVLCQRIEELDQRIKPLEDQLRPLKNEFEQISEFLKKCRCDERRTKDVQI